MKRLVKALGIAVVSLGLLSGCGNSGTGAGDSAFDASKSISVMSREAGSGTRGAFTELFNTLEKTANGKKDLTTAEAMIAKQTDIMMTSVAGNPYAIGYISLGSLNDSVKALAINGVAPTAENIKAGNYVVARPFNIATKGAPEGVTKDFLDFILSAEGQQIAGKHYIAVRDGAAPYSGTKPSGKIVVAGSSSVSPLMEKLIEGYKAVNPNATIELQTNDSSAGMQSTMEGTSQLGMASRHLKESEQAALQSVEIARDGIAIIVNTKNPRTNLTKEQVRDMYIGKVTHWNEVGE